MCGHIKVYEHGTDQPVVVDRTKEGITVAMPGNLGYLDRLLEDAFGGHASVARAIATLIKINKLQNFKNGGVETGYFTTKFAECSFNYDPNIFILPLEKRCKKPIKNRQSMKDI